MGRPRGYDRDNVLVAARDLFWEQGYEATSISDLEQRTGLNRSSLYHEFGSKHELFEAALECYADRVIAQLLADLRNDEATLDTVAALFRRLAKLFRTHTGLPARHRHRRTRSARRARQTRGREIPRRATHNLLGRPQQSRPKRRNRRRHRRDTRQAPHLNTHGHLADRPHRPARRQLPLQNRCWRRELLAQALAVRRRSTRRSCSSSSSSSARAAT